MTAPKTRQVTKQVRFLENCFYNGLRMVWIGYIFTQRWKKWWAYMIWKTW